MILKKPYAFLIKHFRLIHLLLALPIIYLIVCTNHIVNFFASYISSNYYTNITNIAGTYINYFMYLAVLVILIVGLFIYFLMKNKKKSTGFYFFLIIFYVVLFVVIGITHSILSGMEINTLEATVARAYRDVSYIFYLPQFFFAAFTLFRAVGFDIKKFNFDIDIKELEITDIDAEEFEFNIKVDDYKWKRNIRRFIRELRYYILENKFIFSILCAIVVIIFGTLIYLNIGIYNKTYRQTQVLSHNNLNIRVTNSMVTNRDYSGKVFKDNKYYLVLQIKIQNKGKDSQTLDHNNFFIELENRRVYPILDRASYFLDYGNAIRQDTELKSDVENTYVLAYELQESEIKKEYTLKILEQITYKVGEIAPEYKKVSLKPYHAINLTNIKELNMGKIMTFENSNIGYSSLQVKNYTISSSFSYQYNSCYDDNKCRQLTDKVLTNSNLTTLIILEGNYTIDNSTIYFNTARTNRLFPEHFLSIQYTDESGTKIVEATDKTPQTYQNGIILETSSEIEKASKIDLIATIREKRYIIHLK